MPKIDKKALGTRIKSLRLAKGYTLKDFSKLIQRENKEESEITESIISRWERGVSVPSPNRLKAIASIEGISVDELLYGPQDEYITRLLREAILKNHHIELSADELSELFNTLLPRLSPHEFNYTADTLYSENKDIIQEFVLTNELYEKWGLIEYSKGAVRKAIEEVQKAYNQAIRVRGHLENEELLFYQVKDILYSTLEKVDQLDKEK